MTDKKFTMATINALKPPTASPQEVHWDPYTQGLGVLVSRAKGTKTFILQRKLGPKGKTRRITIGQVALGLDHARTEGARLYAILASGKDPKAVDPKGNTLRQVLESYLVNRVKLAERTKANYRGQIESKLSAWLDMPIRSITTGMVMARHKQIAEECAVKGSRRGGGEQNGQATADIVMTTLRALYSHAVKLDDTLPPKLVKLDREEWFGTKPRTRTVRKADLPAFYASVVHHAETSRLYSDLIQLMLFTGMRIGEASGLKWSEVDFDVKAIRIPGKRIKTKRPLNLPMSDLVHDLLVARRAIGYSGDFVFPSPGRSGHASDTSHAFHSIARECGVLVSNHDLRRAFVIVANETVSARAARMLVGHSEGGVHEGYHQTTADEDIEFLMKPTQAVADELRKRCQIGGLPAEVAKIA